MRVITDTNLLVRLVTLDDLAQAEVVERFLEQAERVILPITALCELCWVLTTAYQQPSTAVAESVEYLVGIPNAVTDHYAVEIGLKVLRQGGDFADGAIAATGARAGGDHFATLDKQAARLLAGAGMKVHLLTS